MKKFLVGCFLLVFVLCSSHVYAALLVYDSGTDGTVLTAMTSLGYTYDVRDASTPVTDTDLATYEALVVGWNWNGDMSGLPDAVLASGITGNILLTGHDADFHAGIGDPAAATFLDQSIGWALSGGGTGLVALGDGTTAFGYLPGGWGISATGFLGSENISSFTAEGLASGVYDGLTPADMSNWGNSYHAIFDAWGSGFTAFELGLDDTEVVTIARAVPEPATMLLLGFGLIGLAGLGRRKFFNK